MKSQCSYIVQCHVLHVAKFSLWFIMRRSIFVEGHVVYARLLLCVLHGERA